MLEINDAIEELKELKKNDKLIIFVGSGISALEPTKLPTWDGFLKEFIKFCRELSQRYIQFDLDKQLSDDILNAAENSCSKYPIEVATVLRDKLLQTSKRVRSNIENDFKAWFTNFFGNRKHNRYHQSIVQANFPYILTSNYDTLLETAAISEGKIYASVSYHENPFLAEVIYTNEPAIIHIHGKFTDVLIDKIILTNQDYFKIIKRHHQALTFTMHTLLMRYSTLFVGYGASDPHLEDLVEEMATYFHYQEGYKLPKNYLVLKKNQVDPIKDYYKQKIGTEIMVINDYDEYNLLFQELKEV